MSAAFDEALAKNEANYNPEAWKNYSLAELCGWVENLTKRSTHRSNEEKKSKDLTDAQNYLDMIKNDVDNFIQKMQDNIDANKGSALPSALPNSCGGGCGCK